MLKNIITPKPFKTHERLTVWQVFLIGKTNYMNNKNER
jgi:hypothetical protein